MMVFKAPSRVALRYGTPSDYSASSLLLLARSLKLTQHSLDTLGYIWPIPRSLTTS